MGIKIESQWFVTVRIVREQPVSPAQKTTWRTLWQKLLDEVKHGKSTANRTTYTCSTQHKRCNHTARHHLNSKKGNVVPNEGEDYRERNETESN
jgi:hypothetical protein